MDRSVFIEHLRHSRLLSEEACAAAAARVPETARGRALARALIADGLLTQFQARKLLAGKPGGLYLGQYRILDRIARGGTGPVFKAMHGTMGRVVALKVIAPEALGGGVTPDMFMREVLTAARLNHPGIVTAYDAGVARGKHFLVMEYVDGPSLQSLVQARGPLSVSFACDLMRQTAEALQYAHEKGMVHRDIKPANLLIAHAPGFPVTEDRADHLAEPSPQVKIIDFGLARLHHAGTTGLAGTIQVEPGTVWGTVDYISPEQAENIHAADIRSDLYSLGCTFYYALTGRVPFPARTALEKLVRHLTHEAPSVKAVRPGVPAPVAALTLRLMAKDPVRRFQTPAELAKELAGVGRLEDEDSAAETIHGLEEEDFVDLPEDAAGRAGLARSRATATPVIDAAFVDNWRRWTALIGSAARGRGQRINPRSFQQLRKRLIEGCETGARATGAGWRELFERLAGLVKPWVTPQTLMRTDKEILASLLLICQQADQQLNQIMAAQTTAGGGQTVLGAILALFKGRRD
jgi:serine/threonine protein kinase